MQADLEKLRAHADAVDALFADNVTRLNALVEAQGIIVGYDRSPMREMALQSLAKTVVRMQESQSSLSPYSRTLRLYIGEVEKNQSR
jgi:hypothetical protein